MKQKELILRREWDYLVVLDACRYDSFKEIYPQHLKGELRKVRTAGSPTSNWAVNTFGKNKLRDVVYVSGNPWINGKLPMKGFNATDHFHEIIDVWDWGWNKKKGTVPAHTVTSGLKKAERLYPHKKKILHYMQPHFPYVEIADNYGVLYCLLCPLLRFKVGNNIEIPIGIPKTGHQGREGGYTDIQKKLSRFFSRHLTQRLESLIREAFGVPLRNPTDTLLRKGVEKLKHHYRENLHYVLREVSMIDFPSKTFITSDHGEFLGEARKQKSLSPLYSPKDDKWCVVGHPQSDNPIIRSVPWFRIK